MDGRGGNETLHIRIVGDGDDASRDVRGVRREVKGLGDDVRRQAGVWRDHNGRLRDARGRFVAMGDAAERAGLQVERSGRRMDRSFRTVHRRSEGLGNSLLRLRLVAAALTFGPAVQGANALTASLISLTSAVGPAVGGLAAVPSVLSAIAQGAVAAKVATGGVGDAIKASLDRQKTAVKDTTAATETHRAAVERTSDAERRARLTQHELTQARRDARREIDELERSLKRLELTERGANLSLEQARQAMADTLADPFSSSLDERMARQRVREARAELADVRREQRETAAKVETPVERMPQVVQAKRAAADADRDLARAQRDVRLEMADTTAAIDRQQQAMDELSPAAREFVRTILSLKPAYDQLQAIGASNLFPGVQQGIRDARRLEPLVQRLTGRTAGALGNMAADAGGMLGSPGWMRDLETLGNRNLMTLERLGDGTLALADAYRHVMVEADPFLDWLTASTTEWAENKAAMAEAGRESGSTAAFFDRSRFALERLASIGGNLGGALGNIFEAGEADGRHFLVSLDRITGRFERWTGSLAGQNALREWFADGRETMGDVGDAIGELRDSFNELKDEGRSTSDALIFVFTEALTDVISEGAETMAEKAPVIAEAFVRGFLNANVWGKLAIGAFLASKLRLGAGGLGRGLGGAGGGLLGNKPVPVWVVNQGGAPGAPGGPAGKGGKGGGISNLAKFGLGAGGVLTIVAGTAILSTTGPQFDGPVKPGADPNRDRLFNAMGGKGGGGAVQQHQLYMRQQDDWAKNAKRRTEEVSQAYERTGSVQTRVLSKAERDLADLRMHTARETQRIKERFVGDTRDGKEALARNYREAADAAKRQMDRSGRVTKDGLDFIRRMMVAELKIYGLSGSQALNILKGNGKGGQYGDPDNNLGREGGAPIAKAGGGFIGSPGEAGRDTVPVMVGRGEAVLNRHQQQVVNGALGAVGIGGLGDLFSKVDRPHYMAKGGIVGIPGFPGESIDRRILPDVLAITRRYRQFVTDGYAATGHAAAGEHPLGLAVDLIPHFAQSGSWGQTTALANWAEPSQGSPRDPFRWVGYTGDPNHGEGNHLHLSWQHGPGSPAAWVKTLGGKLLGGRFGNIARVKVGGEGSPLRSIMQGGLDRVRGAANDFLARALGTDVSQPGRGTAFKGSWNAVLGQIAEQRGWSAADWRELVRRESGGNPAAVNPSSGAFGLGQFLGSTAQAYAPYGALSKDPVRQIEAMARYISDRYGNPSSALAFHTANNWYSGGGIVGAARGFQFGPSWPSGWGAGKRKPGRTRTDRSPYSQPTDVLAEFLSGISQRFQARRILAELNNRDGDPSLLQDDLALAREAVSAWTSWLGVAHQNNSLSGIITAGGELQSAQSWLADLTRTDSGGASAQDSERASILATLLGESQQNFRVSQAQFKALANFPTSMVPFVGSFATGGVVPETGLAYVHKGETVTPPGQPPVVQLVMNADMAALWRAADGRIDQRIKGAQGEIEYRAARNRQRAFSGPGGRR